MNHLRLAFLALVSAGCLGTWTRDMEELLWAERVDWSAPPQGQVVPDPTRAEAYVPLPEPREWYSFLNQETGTWKKEVSAAWEIEKKEVVVR